MHKVKTNQGQSLFEVVFAIGIMALVSVAIVSVSTITIRNFTIPEIIHIIPKNNLTFDIVFIVIVYNKNPNCSIIVFRAINKFNYLGPEGGNQGDSQD